MKNKLQENMSRFKTKNLNEQANKQEEQLDDLLSLLAVLPGVGSAAEFTKILQKANKDKQEDIIDDDLAETIIALIPILGDAVRAVRAVKVLSKYGKNALDDFTTVIKKPWRLKLSTKDPFFLYL